MKKALAIDMGATSIRGILGWVENGKLHTEEVMRMGHRLVEKNGRLCWEWEKLAACIEETVCRYAGEIQSVGVDTWGVDFGLLDEAGKLLQAPISYRDPKHEEGFSEVLSQLGGEKLFLGTGTQLMAINTLFQLVTLQKCEPEIWKKAKHLLLMPDLVSNLLCGSLYAEETILSTAQVMDLETVRLDAVLLDRFGIPESLFPEKVRAGKRLGTTKTAQSKRLRELPAVDVIAVCGHDTASAVLVTEAFRDENCMFLSCGTWSLFGALTDHAILTKQAYRENLTNELGYNGRNMFFKNMTGLYLIEKLKEELEATSGRPISFEEISAYAKTHPNQYGLIDVEAPQFGAHDVNVREAVQAFLREKGEAVPKADMEYFGIIYESIAQKCLESKQAIEQMTGRSYRALHMIGGGAKSEYLCQLKADRLGIPVMAGPFEATAYGNIIVQLLAEGELTDLAEGIRLVQEAEEVKQYLPH